MTDGYFHEVVKNFPAFKSPLFLRNGHVQTIVASYLKGRCFPNIALCRRLILDDGDPIVLHDDKPKDWHPTDPTALLVHGLAGSHSSGYMNRVAGKLQQAGVRVFRMDMRACGAGEGMSRRPYHPGISKDLGHALDHVVDLCPLSPISLVGFSIGGNIVLKLLGENADNIPHQVDRAVVINPTIDLPACMKRFKTLPVKLYDRHLVKHLYRQFHRSKKLVKHAPHVTTARPPRKLREFDKLYTSKVWGFETVDHFYEDASALPTIENIRIPSLVISSRDDPIVPVEMFESFTPPPSMNLHITDHGGHLGFIGRPGVDPDQRWMDWRIVDWVQASSNQALEISA